MKLRISRDKNCGTGRFYVEDIDLEIATKPSDSVSIENRIKSVSNAPFEAKVFEILSLMEDYGTINKNGFLTGTYRFRSAGDIYACMRHYFDETRLKKVLLALFNLVIDNEVGTMFCDTIRKRVYVCKEKYDERNAEKGECQHPEYDECCRCDDCIEYGGWTNDIYDIDESGYFFVQYPEIADGVILKYINYADMLISLREKGYMMSNYRR